MLKPLYQALDKLTDEQLSFIPREGLWSLGTIARHVAEAEEGWFRHAATRELEKWPHYAASDYSTVESVKTHLAEVHARTEAYLETLTLPVRTGLLPCHGVVKLPYAGSSGTCWSMRLITEARFSSCKGSR